MTFTEILLFLDKGYAVRRKEYANELIIFKQIPAYIDNVSFVKSIPEKVKNLLLKYKVGIDYQNQYIIYDSLNKLDVKKYEYIAVINKTTNNIECYNNVLNFVYKYYTSNCFLFQ